jgi:cell division protein FtsW
MVKAWIDRNLKGDPVIWAIIFALSIISILVVYSSTGALAYKKMNGNTEHYLMKHSMLVFLSLGAMWAAHKINYKYYAGLSKLGLFISVPLLIYAFKFGDQLNEATRWVTIPIIHMSFQPSDFAKLALVSALAAMLAKKQNNIDDFKKSFLPMILWCAAICGLIALSNFSTSLILFATCMLLMLIGRVPVKHLFLFVVIGLAAGTLALWAGERLGTMISRIAIFINQLFFDGEVPFQAEQSYIALASGGTIGLGPGNSIQRNFLPHSYSDFIYSIIVEEYGLIGGVFVLFLYLALLYRGMIIVVRSDKAFGGLLSAGLCFGLVIQAMINMGVAVGLGPITGQPLPLLSMGGTSLLFTGIALGIILSVSRGDISESSIATNGSSASGKVIKNFDEEPE